MPGEGAVHISLRLESGADPVVGAVSPERGAERSFCGWIELFSILTELARGADAPSDRPSTEGDE